ncbi:glycoside hydrolase family 43 protein [Hyalangium versicolor]|uniref:glycoside hydrolase family 43 protein n=1 Tax=Hyalangium versicolor TaxID=2861190 RepID=UPI001CCF7D3A|nr:glycoside hydrolase family 43 protein [Hyalangium versicolor]
MQQLLLVAALFTVSAASAQTFTNPILPETSADPSIVLYNGFYYHASSAGDAGIQVRKSSTLTGLASASAVRVWTAPATGAYSKEVWAPEIQLINGRWYIYFAASDGNNANHRMYVLESASLDAQGAYTFRGQLKATTDRWAIDGAAIQKDDGSLYFVWSGWSGTTDGQQNLYIAPMSNPYTVSGERVLISQPTFMWEGRAMTLNEGPQPIRLGGKYAIIFSASGSWTREYTLGLLTNTDGNLLNPKSWVKTGPVFRQNGDVYGVGHPTFVKSPDGSENWIAYHAKRLSSDGWGDRSVRAQKFYVDSAGSLNLGVARSVSIAQPKPAGEGGAPASANLLDGNGWGGSFEGAGRVGSWTISSPTAATSTTLGAGWASLFRGNPNFETVAASANVRWIATGTTAAYPKFGIFGAYKDQNNYIAVFLDKKYGVLATHAMIGGVDKGWQNSALPAGFSWTVAHNLRIERSWSGSQKFYLDGALQQTRALDNVIGMMGLVTEDTQAEYTGVTLDSLQGWGDPASDWAGNGMYEIRSAQDVVAWQFGGGWKSLWRTASPTTANYTVESGVRLLSQGSTAYPKYGIYGCFQNGANYMTAWMDPKSGVLATHAVGGGVDLGWQNTALSGFTFTSTHSLKVVRSGSTFTVYVDGVQKQSRTVGLSGCQTGVVAEDSQAEFTGFRVY